MWLESHIAISADPLDRTRDDTLSLTGGVVTSNPAALWLAGFFLSHAPPGKDPIVPETGVTAFQLHVVEALAFTVGCAVIHGLRTRARSVTGMLLTMALLLAVMVAAGELATVVPDEPGSYANTLDQDMLVFGD